MKKTKILILVFMLLLPMAMNAKKKAECTHVRWATFNVRLDTPRDGLNGWSYRKDSAAQMILDQNIDIVGMQEVLHNQLTDFQSRLPQYATVGVGREDGKDTGEYSPLFFRKDKYKLLDTGTFWLSENPEEIGKKGWDAACPRVATWAKLRDLATGRVFLAVNTHFDHVGKVARTQSALLIIERIKKIVGNKPAVLTGDFNVTDQSVAYKTITTNDFNLLDSHKIAAKTEGVTYSFHDFGRKDVEKRDKIDFIFVTPHFHVSKSVVLKEGNSKTGFLSDHCPVIADLEF